VLAWDVRRWLQLGELHRRHVGRQLNVDCFPEGGRKGTVKYDVCSRFLCVIADFTDRICHHMFPLQVFPALDPLLY